MKWLSLLLACLLLMQCRDNVEELGDCPALELPETTYSLHVFPIISTTCAIPECHTDGFEHGNFNRFDEFREKVAHGKLEFMITKYEMPHGFTDGPKYLTNCEIETIKKWISEGARNN